MNSVTRAILKDDGDYEDLDSEMKAKYDRVLKRNGGDKAALAKKLKILQEGNKIKGESLSVGRSIARAGSYKDLDSKMKAKFDRVLKRKGEAALEKMINDAQKSGFLTPVETVDCLVKAPGVSLDDLKGITNRKKLSQFLGRV